MTNDPEKIAAEAVRLVQIADSEGLTLRISGGAAVHLHVTDRSLPQRLGREPMSDIDFVAPKKHRGGLRKLLERHGYHSDPSLLASGEGRRFAFWHRDPPHLEIDLFIDELEMSHTLDWRDRVHLPGPTLPVTDLLLQKLQIARLTEKDVADLMALLISVEADRLELGYLADLLANDWGFHHTVELNLERVLATALDRELSTDERARLHARVIEARTAIDSAPKSRRWHKRAKVGERKPWFEHVEDDKTAF